MLAEVRETNRNIDQLLKEPQIKSFLTDASVSMARTRRILEKSEEPLSQLMGSLKNEINKMSYEEMTSRKERYICISVTDNEDKRKTVQFQSLKTLRRR